MLAGLRCAGSRVGRGAMMGRGEEGSAKASRESCTAWQRLHGSIRESRRSLRLYRIRAQNVARHSDTYEHLRAMQNN